jgi:Zn-dependent protease
MNITTVIIALVSVLVSMVLHELMHAFIAYRLGDTTAKEDGRLTLNPLAHIDPITTVALPVLLIAAGLPPFGAAKPVMINPDRLKGGEWGSALVAVAGPLTNLLLAILAGLGLRFFGVDMADWLVNALIVFITINIGFFIFNMIPFPPLDGSRVLYAIAPDGVRRVMQTVESLGFIAIIIFMVLFYTVLSGPFQTFMQWFLSNFLQVIVI